MMQHYQHNKRTQIFCYVVLLLYYRFKFLKNITPKSVWLMPDLNNPRIIQIWHLLEYYRHQLFRLDYGFSVVC